MTKVRILYYSAYGHMERMAQAVADGVRDASVEADIKRVPELVPEEVAKRSGFKLDQKAPIATIAENYDAIIFGSGTRFGVFRIRHATWRTGINHSVDDPYASSSRHDCGRAPLRISGAEHDGRD